MDSNLAVVKSCSIMEPLRSTNQIQITRLPRAIISHLPFFLYITSPAPKERLEYERMDDKLLEKMDSLWFFSSVLRPSSQLLTQNAQISTKSNEYTDAEKQEQVGEQTAANDTSQKAKEDCNCVEIAGLEKRKGKRKGRKSKNRVQKWIQQSSAATQWEERTPFAVLYDCQMRNSRSNERGGIDSKFRRLTTPLVSDDLTMKEHLRSWAYAVACSVR